MNRFFTLLFIFLLSFNLYATEYVKIWVNDEESSSVIQGDQFAWEFDVSVNGGTGNFLLILDLNENETYDEGDVVLIEFSQTDGAEENDGPGDSDGEENGVVYSPLGPFGFAPAYYVFQVTDDNDQSQASAAFHVNALADPAATVHGNISKSDVASPSPDLQNIMIMAQLSDGFAGFWTALSDNQGNYTINLPDTAVGTVWDIRLFDDNQQPYIVDQEFDEVTIKAGPNSGFNFHFDLPSSYVYGKLLDDQGKDIIIDDYIALENIYSDDEFRGQIKDGAYNIPISFPPGENSAQFRINFWGDSIPPDYMIPHTWDNDDFYVTVNENDSLEKNITLQRTDQKIYVRILMEGGSPGMQFELEAYDDKGYTTTLTDEDGWGVLSVSGTGYYWVMVRFDHEDLEPLPQGYTFEAGTHSSGFAGDTVQFNIVGATSSISGAITFAEGDPTPDYDPDDFYVEVEEESWGNTLRADLDESLIYRFDLADGTYDVWFDTYEDDYLAMPNSYQDLALESDSMDNANFELNYRHANIFVKLKNAHFDASHYSWNIYTWGEPPYIYETWTNGNQDSTYHFRVCDGEWYLEPPQADTSLALKLTVTNEGLNYYVEFDYNSLEITTGLEEDKPAAAQKFELKPNYPNPFNPTTTIRYSVGAYRDTPVRVLLVIYDIVGREVQTLVNEAQSAGSYSIHFDASALPSGLYFYKLATSAGFIETRKMLLVK